MAKYANRTCYSCGIRLPQPEMAEKIIEEKAGHSTGYGTNFLSWFDEKRKNNINLSRRNYTRKKKVWMCPSCNNKSSWLENVLGFFVILFVVLLFI
jgi:hypothetical protein